MERRAAHKPGAGAAREPAHAGHPAAARGHVAGVVEPQRPRAGRARPVGEATAPPAAGCGATGPESEVRLVEAICALEDKAAAWRPVLWQLTVLAERSVSDAFLDFLYDWDLEKRATQAGFVATQPGGARVCTAVQWFAAESARARAQAQDLASFNGIQVGAGKTANLVL